MTEIHYVRGDATRPQGNGDRIIAHVCNDVGAWGGGFTAALSSRWTLPESAYRSWARRRLIGGFRLGRIDLVPVDSGIWVANMLAQKGVGPGPDGPPIRYDALRACLRDLAKAAGAGLPRPGSVHMPRIGCGLAGGRWEEVEPLVRAELCGVGIAVTVYDLP